MWYQFWLFLHIVGVLGFLGAHGVSMFITFRLRREREPHRIVDLLALSGSTTRLMYVSLIVIIASGTVAGSLGHWWSQGWIWAALMILVLTTVLMYVIAKPYYKRVGFVARALAGGSTAVSDEQFDQILRSPRSHAIMTIGIASLVVIVYLMVFKPSLGMGASGSAAPLPKPSGTVLPCTPNGTSLQISAKDTAFSTNCLAAPAAQAFTIVFDNQDPFPHNVSIYTNSSASTALFTGQLQTAAGTITYQVGALQAGTYFFRCDVHPTQMTGTFIVR